MHELFIFKFYKSFFNTLKKKQLKNIQSSFINRDSENKVLEQRIF